MICVHPRKAPARADTVPGVRHVLYVFHSARAARTGGVPNLGREVYLARLRKKSKNWLRIQIREQLPRNIECATVSQDFADSLLQAFYEKNKTTNEETTQDDDLTEEQLFGD